ncbi:MAG: MFS transporter [Alphaproteobacteria bacterium]|nr:MFS transporter [Alphaproteobacteria bacterium]
MIINNNLPQNNSQPSKIYYLTILLVTALGNFVDYFDLFFTTLVRNEAITYLKLAQTKEELLKIGINFETWQSLGFLGGCFTWGILADKKGRIKILFASIALYSITTLCNGFLEPNTPYVYELYLSLRFLSGWGLAAEFGIAITLITEIFPVEKRLIGTMIITAAGFLGAACSSVISLIIQISWQTYFKIGGIMGLCLLIIRFATKESFIFQNQPESKIGKGNLWALVSNKNRRRLLLKLIGICLPIFVLLLIAKFSSQISGIIGIKQAISLALYLIIFDFGAIVSDIIGCYISKILKNRQKPLLIYNLMSYIAIICFICFPPTSAYQFYLYAFVLSIASGYWGLMCTTVVELFGTNIRATAAVMVTNISRASFAIIALMFEYLQIHTGYFIGLFIVATIVCSIAIYCSATLPESADKNLNYIEN